MKPSDLAARLDRVQRSRSFKLIASVIILVLALGAIIAAVVASGPDGLQTGPDSTVQSAPSPAPPSTDGVTEETSAVDNLLTTSAAGRTVADLVNRANNPYTVSAGVAVAAGVLLIIVWVGLFLTYAALALAMLVVCGPLYVIEGTREWGTMLAGVAILWGVFSALMRGAGAMLSFRGPVFSIAKNVLNEAVRLKLSVVFIVLLVFGLAALPGLLNDDSPLRYRVQSFLQYGTGGAFWVIALLTVTFSVATVAFEQRDKVIWQTMTKPVRSWQYVLGKWLGVVTLGAVLMTITCTGVFLFTEYLRQQPAIGERQAYIAFSERGISEDRLILETQVLASRTTVPDLEPEEKQTIIENMMQERIDAALMRDPNFRPSPSVMADIEKVATERAEGLLRTMAPGDRREFEFAGIDVNAAGQRPVILRYRVDSQNNRPDELFDISIRLRNMPFMVRQVSLGTTNTVAIAPAIVNRATEQMVLPEDPVFPALEQAVAQGQAANWEYIELADMLTDEGTLLVQFINGNVSTMVLNPDFIQIPKGWLGVSYADGSYYVNFARVAFVLWLKIAFLAMLGVCTATFLSFPVAILVSMGSFLVAEGAGYMADTIDYFALSDHDQNPLVFNHIAAAITRFITWIFETYTNLRPTQKLVSGESMGWVDVSQGMLLLGAWTLVLGVGASIIFSKRELATYSGR